MRGLSIYAAATSNDVYVVASLIDDVRGGLV